MDPPIVCAPAAPLTTQLATDEEVQTAERVRVHELLRYYQPSISGGATDQQVRVSSDPALTAFAQLAALKLRCERSFISLVDHEYQYIIAEATRSISLESEKIRDCDDDALLTGATSLDLVWGMCAATIKVFTSTDGRYNVLTRYLKADKESFVIHDMSKLDQYKDRPYVAGWPFMRFYAEVPISSPNGLAIGSICVVDNMPREGLHPREVTSLKEIADTIMDHLDLVMSRVQRKRSQQMIRGLGVFAEARGTTSTSGGQTGISDSMRELAIKDPNQTGSVTSLESSGHERSGLSSREASDYFYELQKSSSVPATIFLSDTDQGVQEMSLPSEESIESSDRKQSTGGSGSSIDGINKTPNHNNATEVLPTENDPVTIAANEERTPQIGLPQTLSQAVHLIRDAVDLDSLVFFDQRHLGNPGTLTTPGTGEQHVQNSSYQTRQGLEESDAQEARPMANVLAVSCDKAHSPSPTLETLLSRIIKRFARGGILRFGPEGEFSELAEFDLSLNGNMGESPSQDDSISGRPVADLDITRDAQALNQNFKSRSMILFPLWAPTSDKHFAYAIGATSQYTRVFQREDFAYITSFSSLVTSELSRLDALSADRAKSMFISSISHELRSPLHGILASSELLKDSVKDDTAIEIINTIESCGSTLLDTFDNLLTFAKINHFTVAKTQKQREGSVDSNGMGHNRLPTDSRSLTSVFDLSVLVEDVMNSSIAGHYLRTSLDNDYSSSTMKERRDLSSKENKLTVICDIKSADWIISSQPGAWTRIIMNLLGNAMKYTTSGFVRVGLERRGKPSSGSSGREINVVLSVEDTGRGISESFLSNHLYKPFHQEDDLQPGTGLGLSIVKQLVHSANGTIKVKSEVGHGTLCTVTAKVLQPEVKDLSPLQFATLQSSSDLHGLRIGFLGFDFLPSIEEHPTGILSYLDRRNQAIETTLRSAVEGLGLQAKTVTSLAFQDVDVLLTTEKRYEEINTPLSASWNIPFIVLSSSATVDYRESGLQKGQLVYLSQPFGPKRLLRALRSCLAFYKGNSVAAAEHANGQSESVRNTTDITSSEVIRPLRGLNDNLAMMVDGKQRSPRVLLVEDNTVNLKLLVAFVRKLDCPYETAINGQEAIDVYRATQGAFDIVFMDIQMPIKDGMAASAEIRQFEKAKSLSRTLIVAITGVSSFEAQQQALECGVDSYLTKPVSLKMLKAIVEEASELKPEP